MLKNITKNKIMSKNTKFADNFFKRAKGLMFSSRNNFNYSLPAKFVCEDYTYFRI